MTLKEILKECINAGVPRNQCDQLKKWIIDYAEHTRLTAQACMDGYKANAEQWERKCNELEAHESITEVNPIKIELRTKISLALLEKELVPTKEGLDKIERAIYGATRLNENLR